MNKSLFFKFFFLLSIGYNTLQADLPKPTKYSRFEIGPECVNIHLHIHSTSTTKAENFHGDLFGWTAALEYKEPKGVYLNLNGFYVSNPITGSHHNKRFFRELRIEGRIGYNFSLGCSQKWTIIPYTGFGFGRITQSHVGPLSLTVSAPTYYVPIGLITLYKINDHWNTGISLKYMTQVDATVKFSNIKHARWELKKRYSFVAEIPVIYSFQCPFKGTVSLVPYWRVLEKGSGDAASLTGQKIKIPAQTYYFLGVKLLFGINF